MTESAKEDHAKEPHAGGAFCCLPLPTAWQPPSLEDISISALLGASPDGNSRNTPHPRLGLQRVCPPPHDSSSYLCLTSSCRNPSVSQVGAALVTWDCHQSRGTAQASL